MDIRSRLVAPVLGLGQIVAFASSYYLLGVLADPIAAQLDVPSGWLFLALSAAFLVSAILTPTAGRWLERHGGRRVQGGAHVAFAAALLLLAAAPSPAVAVVAIVGLGVGMAIGLYSSAFAILVEIHGQGARPYITQVAMLGALGGALGWPTSRMLLQAFDWRVACAVWAAAHLLACLPLTAFVLPKRPARCTEAEALSGRLCWDRRMIQIAALFAGGWVVATAMGAHLPRLLEGLGLTPARAAWAAGLMGASALAARLFDLLVLHRSRPVLTVRVASLLHPLGVAMAFLGGAKLAPLLAVGQGAGNGLLSTASGVLPLHVFGPERYAVRQAMILTPARYLQAVAPAAWALAIDASPSLALALSSLICLGMCVLTFGLGPAGE